MEQLNVNRLAQTVATAIMSSLDGAGDETPAVVGSRLTRVTATLTDHADDEDYDTAPPARLPSLVERRQLDSRPNNVGPLRSAPPLRAAPPHPAKKRRSTTSTYAKPKLIIKDIVCLPNDKFQEGMAVPKGASRGDLAEKGLIGKISFQSHWLRQEVQQEVSSVFRRAFNLTGDTKLEYEYLSVLPGTRKLGRPNVSTNFVWNAGEVLSITGQGSLYILASNTLPTELFSEEILSESDDEFLPPAFEVRLNSQERPVTSTFQNEEDTLPDIRRNERTGRQPLTVSRIPTMTARQPQTSPHYYFASMLEPDGDAVKELSDYLSINHDNTMNDAEVVEVQDERDYTAVVSGTVMHDILETHRSKVMKGCNASQACQIIRISRSPKLFWPFCLRYFKSSSFDVKSHFKVQFLNEAAVDDGGPKREFLQLLLTNIVESPLLIGEPGKKMPKKSSRAIGDGSFIALGKMVASIIVQGGPSPNVFSDNLLRFMLYGISGVNIKQEDIPDFHRRNMIHRINNTSSQGELFDILEEDEVITLLLECGIDTMVTMANKSQVVTDMSRYIIRDEARSSLEDFVKGLDILGFVAFTKENPAVMYQLLCGKDQKNLGANELYDLFTIEFAGAAESTLRAKEEETNQYFLCFLMELEGGDVVLENGYKPTLEDLLSFVTGSKSVPPGGFPKQPFVYFTGVKCMARASTCDLSLTLPVHMGTYQSFLEMMQECVATSGFGQI